MAGQEKLVEAVPAERQALLALTSVTPATRLGWSALSDYVEQLKARTLWASHDPARSDRDLGRKRHALRGGVTTSAAVERTIKPVGRPAGFSFVQMSRAISFPINP